MEQITAELVYSLKRPVAHLVDRFGNKLAISTGAENLLKLKF